ncbi:unnamed protein product [Sphagnum compactum]
MLANSITKSEVEEESSPPYPKNTMTNLEKMTMNSKDTMLMVTPHFAMGSNKLNDPPMAPGSAQYVCDTNYLQCRSSPTSHIKHHAEDADVSSISEWELDFCSRPILDARGKKLWEIVVCDNRRQLQFACFYPNNVINSVTLRDALASIVETLGVPKPEKIRFFRSQMQTIISKACKELDIQPVPSQRCITLVRWLEERYETVYRRHPGFQEGATPLSLQEQALPLDLPDSLRGEQWTFVQLPLSGVLEEMEAVEKGAMFGSLLDLDTLGIDLSSDIMIPGVAVASSRATPLAAWTNALELASIEVDIQRSCLILSTGVADRWRYAFYRKSRQADAEGEAWESAKKSCGGLHFLAVQESLDSELCTGFWLLIDVQRSPV